MMSLLALLSISQPVELPFEIEAATSTAVVTITRIEYDDLLDKADLSVALNTELSVAAELIREQDTVLLWHNKKLHELAANAETSPPIEDIVIYSLGITGAVAAGIGLGAELSNGSAIDSPWPVVLDISGGLAAGLALLRALGAL